jgi:ariadne-1
VKKEIILIDAYIDNSSKVCKTAGVVLDGNHPIVQNIKGFVCDICCSESDKALALSCGHLFCTDCYTAYLEHTISLLGQSTRISCPANCSISVDDHTINMLVSPTVRRKYEQLLLKTFVDCKPFFKWCPYPNCIHAVECHVPDSQLEYIVPTVSCPEDHSFCFGCSGTNHQPATCKIAKLWLKKCADDSETANWISANTKECVKCKSIIEKNGGCNHMTCKKCGTEVIFILNQFCWVCLGNWAEHGSQWYNCNRYQEKSGIDARDSQALSRAALERYLHVNIKIKNSILCNT